MKDKQPLLDGCKDKLKWHTDDSVLIKHSLFYA